MLTKSVIFQELKILTTQQIKMTTIFHVAAECFPVAKVGGLADVVGALPKYQTNKNTSSEVIMPFYQVKFTEKAKTSTIFQDAIDFEGLEVVFTIKKFEKKGSVTINFVDIPNWLDTDFVYSNDDTKRFLLFQIATLKFINSLKEKPSVIHVHDHHTGLIPFMMQNSYEFLNLKDIPVIFTIHNAQYQGWFSHDLIHLIPPFDFNNVGLLDWGGVVNPMAAAIKCAWKVTTVSPSYMEELRCNSNGLEMLFEYEKGKCEGVLNGIDSHVWNPETDSYLIKNYKVTSSLSGKKANKLYLCNKFGFDENLPLFVFIGRLVHDKGCDVFPNAFENALYTLNVNVLMLGSGDETLQNSLENLNKNISQNYHFEMGYKEELSHIMYAGADFLLMPSRVEPCGLNQMYALRYGTIPVVNNVGGLKDTIIDLSNETGYGLIMNQCSAEELVIQMQRAIELYFDDKSFKKVRTKIMKIDNSWDNSATQYLTIYNQLLKESIYEL